MTRTPISAAVLRHPGEAVSIETALIDSPLPTEVRLRTLAVGLCHSDLHYVSGNLPIDVPAVLGHEVCGEVEAVGEACKDIRVGDRMVATITPNCGKCANCVRGRAALCQRSAVERVREQPKLTDQDGIPINQLGGIGAFAEAVLVSENALVPVDSSVPSTEACLLGCCVATGFGAIVHGAHVSPLDTVAVIGCGGVGIAAIQAARIAGASRVIAIDLHDEKLRRAQSFGATDLVRADDRLVAAVHEKVPGGVDKSFEAVGSPTTATAAFNILAPNGTATILGLQPGGNTISIDAEMLIEGDRKITGAYMGANRLAQDMRSFSHHRRRGTLDLASMVTSTWSFEEINAGLKEMTNPDSVRAVVTI